MASSFFNDVLLETAYYATVGNDKNDTRSAQGLYFLLTEASLNCYKFPVKRADAEAGDKKDKGRR